jgi:hypothetical protein
VKTIIKNSQVPMDSWFTYGLWRKRTFEMGWKSGKGFDVRDKKPLKWIWLYAKRYFGKTIKYQTPIRRLI